MKLNEILKEQNIESVKHLVIRTTNFLPKGMRDNIRLYSPGYTIMFTQSFRHRNPFMYGKAHKGDALYLAEASYGILALCKITEEPKLDLLQTTDELEKFKSTCPANLQVDENYWSFERDKLAKVEAGKSLHIVSISFEIIAVDFPHFPINKKISGINKWILIEDNAELFKFVENISVQEYFLMTGQNKDRKDFITELTYDSINKIKRLFGEDVIYSTNPFNIVVPADNCSSFGAENSYFFMPKTGYEIEHTIPSSIWGPGIFFENVVPVDKDLNFRKKNILPLSFFCVLKKMFPELITDEFQKLFQNELNRDDKFILTVMENEPDLTQKKVLTKLMKKILKKKIKEQKIFYFCTSMLFYGTNYFYAYENVKDDEAIGLKFYEDNPIVAEIKKMVFSS